MTDTEVANHVRSKFSVAKWSSVYNRVENTALPHSWMFQCLSTFCERKQSYLSWLHPTFKTSKVCADYLLRLFARVCTNSTVSTTHINASHARRGFFSTAMTFFYFAHTYIVSMKFAIWKHIVATLKLSYCL